MLKVSENPPVIWPEDAESIRDFAGQWWVLHTKSRNEKALAHDLIAKQISYFLPMAWKIHHTRGRKIKSLLPLFTGYMFFSGDEKQRVEVLRTNRVANIIEVPDQQQLIKELIPIEQAFKAGVDLQPHKYIKAGQRCQVTSGPLIGTVGIAIQTNKGATKLVMQIDMLGQAASVEIDTDIIEIVDE